MGMMEEVKDGSDLFATFDTTDLPTFDRSNPLRQSPAVAAAGTGLQKDFKDAYVQEWNFTLEHSVGSNLFSVGYVGNRASHVNSVTRPLYGPAGQAATRICYNSCQLSAFSFQLSAVSMDDGRLIGECGMRNAECGRVMKAES